MLSCVDMTGRTEIVVAAMIVGDDGRILIAERPEGKFMAGWWEFPGGKLEFGEPPEAGLAREVREELGIEIEVDDPFHVVNVARTPESAVLVVFYWCRWTGGQIELLDAGDVRWVTVDEFASVRFLESNRAVVEKLRRTGALPTPNP
jgi:8-oxo-dGTP diphosphatase